jgi:S-adenosylmethionine:tRNA ribosyltransferase-isomerase
MKLTDFDYHLPKELIAQYPLAERDAARLLVLDRKKETLEHRVFRDILEYLKPEDLLVLNDTKVLPSRLKGKRRTGGKVELLLLKRKHGLTFSALVKPARVKIQEEIAFDGIRAKVSAKNEVTFLAKGVAEIYAQGQMPLPPYIKREPEDSDSADYQTVYARRDGAIASPTAGLHFTEDLLQRIKSAGINISYLTLHVGYGTFKPVKIDEITRHKMEAEIFCIPDTTISALEKRNGRIFAVGTTSCRALEAYAQGKKEGSTDLFIYPGYKFKIVDALITNFHLPRTTLFMLACAFAGQDLMKKAYQEAIEKKYRFYSYGDTMLIL